MLLTSNFKSRVIIIIMMRGYENLYSFPPSFDKDMPTFDCQSKSIL